MYRYEISGAAPTMAPPRKCMSALFEEYKLEVEWLEWNGLYAQCNAMQ